MEVHKENEAKVNWIDHDEKFPAKEITTFDLDGCPKGEKKRYWLEIVRDGLGRPVSIPVIVAKGMHDGPVLAMTAAVHGNELNGIPVIQRVFRDIDPKNLHGCLIGIPVVNVPSLLRKKRRFPDGKDLNHIMPGKPEGNLSEVYAYHFTNKLVRHFDYLIDLHTASFGRINSFYVRADMSHATTARLAWLQTPDIIVHNPPADGTLRGAASAMDIPAITLEVGDPNRFQKGMISSGLDGLYNVMKDLGMIEGELTIFEQSPVLCSHSYWVYTDQGGMLTVLPKLTDFVKKGDIIARQTNVFGDLLREYLAPESGVVIGRSVNPISQSGSRILHLGIKSEKNDVSPDFLQN